MKKYILFIIGLLLGVNINTNAQGVTKVGTTAAGFLLIDVGPRATAMGSANVSVANDASAMYWNPAGIAKVDNFDVLFTNTKWIADLSLNYAGAVLPLGDVREYRCQCYVFNNGSNGAHNNHTAGRHW